MVRYKIDEAEWEVYDQIFDGNSRHLPKRGIDEPKRSPICRKGKMWQEEEMKPKAKRINRKVLRRIKYEWKDE